jgi:hypothetical protein
MAKAIMSNKLTVGRVIAGVIGVLLCLTIIGLPIGIPLVVYCFGGKEAFTRRHVDVRIINDNKE